MYLIYIHIDIHTHIHGHPLMCIIDIHTNIHTCNLFSLFTLYNTYRQNVMMSMIRITYMDTPIIHLLLFLTCIQAYIQTNRHIAWIQYIHLYIHGQPPCVLHTCIHTYIHTYTHIYIHTYVHTFSLNHTYIHFSLHNTFIHTFDPLIKSNHMCTIAYTWCFIPKHTHTHNLSISFT